MTAMPILLATTISRLFCALHIVASCLPICFPIYHTHYFSWLLYFDWTVLAIDSRLYA